MLLAHAPIRTISELCLLHVSTHLELFSRNLVSALWSRELKFADCDLLTALHGPLECSFDSYCGIDCFNARASVQVAAYGMLHLSETTFQAKSLREKSSRCVDTCNSTSARITGEVRVGCGVPVCKF